jgi:pimeloyl-ACP methyl ester carboxylesterase
MLGFGTSTAALALGIALSASTASAVDIRREEGTLPSGFPYQISMPPNWNGTVISDLDAVTNLKEAIPVDLLSKGFAYIGTGRHPERMTKHDPLTELDAQAAVIDLFTQKFGRARHVVQYGCSGGGYVTLAMAERHPDKIDGAVAFNARGTGGMAVANTWLDLPFALKALLAPESDLLVAPVPGSALPEAYDAWKAVMDKAQATPEGRARIALAVAVSQWPTWGSIDDTPPKPAADDLAALEKAMVKSANDGLGNSIKRRQLYDNPAGLASWNSGIDYKGFYDKGAEPEQKKIVNELYENAGLGGKDGIEKDLAKINAQPPIQGSKDGVNYWLRPGRLIDGNIKVPLLHIHGLGDALLPPHLSEGYAVAVKKQGHQDLYRRAFLEAAGHCKTEVSEAEAAIQAIVDRLETGKWGDTSADGLNTLAKKASTQSPRYVTYSFETPFNRAFYGDSAHPY